MNTFDTDTARRRLLRAALAAPLIASIPLRAARAADYPGSKPIKLVVPFPPGGGTDITGRWIGQALAQELKGTVIVENLAGATGTLGTGQVARAAPDGYTLLLGISATNAIAPALFRNLPYKPERDFTPLVRIAQGGNLFVVHPSLPAKNVDELIALARKPGSDLVYGSWGIGSGGHLAMEALKQHAKLDLPHVPYKGVAPLLQDLIGGTIKVAVVDFASGAPHVQAGKLRPFAVSGPTRSSLLPQVPTLVEQDVPFDTASWYAVFGPAKMPPALVAQLSQALERVLKSPEAAEKIRTLGMEPDPISREAFEQQVRKDIGVWAAIVDKGGIRLE
jgi:tripartite-type tricarboxylate transporter receptor subunit TctC